MKFRFRNKKKLTSIYELPDGYWKMFEKYDLPEPDEMWMVELDIQMEEGDPPLPDEILQVLYKSAIEAQEYEEAEKIKNDLMQRGYSIIIEDDGHIKFEQKSEPEK